jgi:hypothetical protein
VQGAQGGVLGRLAAVLFQQHTSKTCQKQAVACRASAACGIL